MAAMSFDLVIDQGSDYGVVIPVVNGLGQAIDVTSWTAAGQVRADYSSRVLHTLTLTLAGSGVTVRVPAAVSSGWGWTRARYDIEVTAPDGAVTRLVEGDVVVRPEVTRPGL